MIIVNSRFLTQNITGVQRYAIELSLRLKEIYKDKILFVTPKNIIHKDLGKKLDIKIIGKNIGHIWEQLDLPYFLKKIGYPLLINLTNTAPIFYKNKITVIHDIAFVRFPKSFNWKFRYFYSFLIPNIIKTSKKIITVSEFSKHEIFSFYKIKKNKIEIVFNGINTDLFKPCKLNTNSKEKYILSVSSLNPRKNFCYLIKAFNKLNLKNYKLYLIGEIDKNFTNKKLLQEIKKNENIVFKGYVNDQKLVSLYSNAEIFVYPSLYEGFGLPPLEAMACGTPVIVSNVASLPEVCGDAAYYVNPYDINDIARGIQTVLNDEKLQKELIQKGLERVKLFSWEKSAKKLIEIIEGLI